ncbi:hypothetical protein GCM10011369_23500 [Neiella marina]|uniref:Concanavalin A-like lectin/glucanases superfamily protein n=1 Tax=Neiella marina TaxID=508461 RepID=A0A8J2U5Y8_9GAMM|nr:LamG-like jellyroll fold domain-containing protein [Neiella marina]GGA80835.1 hypothetical protein GCM10011369_23500 [Neiella marina]
MSGFISNNVSVANGSTTVTVNDGVDFSQIRQSSVLFIEGQHPVIVNAGSAPSNGTSTLTLATAWASVAINNSKALVIAGTNSLINLIESAKTQGDRLAAMTAALGDLFNTSNDSYTIELSSGEQVTVPTYLYLANQMQAKIDNWDAELNTAVEDKLGEIRYSKLNNPLCHLFKKNKLVETLAGEITWTRASTATYVDRYGVVRTAAIDEPREEAQGLLIEGARTNLLVYSNDLTNAVWGGDAAAIEQAGEAPDSVGPAFLVSSASGTQGLAQSVGSVTTDQKFSFSGWFKKGTSQTIKLQLDNANAVAVFDFDQEIFIAGAANGHFEKIGDWYYLSAFDVNRTTNGAATFRLVTEAGLNVIASQLQVENASFPSSYISTTDAPATRAADSVVFPSFLNAPDLRGEYTLMLSADSLMRDVDPPFEYLLQVGVNETSVATEGLLLIKTATSILFRHSDGNSALDDTRLTPTVEAGTFFIIVSETLIKMYFNGDLVDSIARTANVSANIDGQVYLGRREVDLTQNTFCHISDVRLYDFMLNEAEIKLLAGE